MPTIRQQIIDLLLEQDLSARDISQILRIQERDAYLHLPHIKKTLRTQNKKLTILPFSCLDCGFVFAKRNSFTPPGKCPFCRSTHLEKPVYGIR